MNQHTDELDELFAIHCEPSGDIIERRLCEMSDHEAELARGRLQAEYRALMRVIDAMAETGDIMAVFREADQALQKQSRLLASKEARLEMRILQLPPDGLPF
jgi:hypothetical protein